MQEDHGYSPQGVLFYNRLKKRYKHLKRRMNKLGVYAYRLYDKDIPEVPAAVDVYIEDTAHRVFAVLTEYERSGRIKLGAYDESGSELKTVVCDVLGISSDSVYTKCRKRQRGDTQYEKLSDCSMKIVVREGQCRFIINLSDYLDTGLFFDHRPARLAVAECAAGKSVLNLFCYTASFSIHALAAGAREVHSVDLSKHALEWAHDNARLNGVDDPKRCIFTQSDVRLFLKQAAARGSSWDIIICDPPTFSNSKRAPQFFDINRHWTDLIHDCCTVLAVEGTLYFSTNSRTLRFTVAALSDEPLPSDDTGYFMYRHVRFSITDISAQSIPEDFRNKKIHRLWKITRNKPVLKLQFQNRLL